MKKIRNFTTTSIVKNVRKTTLLSFLILAVLAAGLYYVIGFAEKTKEIANYGFLYESSMTNENEIYITGVIKDHDSHDGEILEFPETLYGKTVIGLKPINDFVFYIDDSIYQSGIKEIIIPGSYMTVEDATVDLFTNTEQLTITNGNVKMKNLSLSGLTKLKNIKLPVGCNSKITNIFGKTEFKGSIETIEFVGIVDSVPEKYFADASYIKKIILPEGIETIENNAFSNCINLSEVVMPSTLKYINDYAFYNCDSISTITLPENISQIATKTFSNCDNLKTIFFGKNIESIGKYAFENCISLEKVQFPDSLKEIYEGAFKGCSNLEKIVFNNYLEKIDSYVFESCTSLTKVTLPDSLKSIGKSSFKECGKLTEVVLSHVMR